MYRNGKDDEANPQQTRATWPEAESRRTLDSKCPRHENSYSERGERWTPGVTKRDAGKTWPSAKTDAELPKSGNRKQALEDRAALRGQILKKADAPSAN